MLWRDRPPTQEVRMRYGFIIPNGDVRTLPDLASDAEAAGWDGVFIPDCICIDPALAPDAPGFDPWGWRPWRCAPSACTWGRC